jgi:hypothetical protein
VEVPPVIWETIMNALHNALAAIDNACTGNGDTSLIRAKCRALLRGYDKRWGNALFQPIAVEKFYKAPLINPDTQKPSRTYRLAGKIDALLQDGNRIVLVDHKTTSQDIQDPEGPYWRQLVVEGQPSHYGMLLWLNGQKVDDTVWDVVRKPTISPRKLSKADIKAVTSFGTYCDTVMSSNTQAALLHDDRETLEMYEARLVNDCVKERPDWYFQRRSVPRLDSELIEYGRELWEHASEMLHARNTGHYARNSGACMLYDSACKFLGICSGYDTPDSTKWNRKQQVHCELPELKGDGKEYITNSRVRCFQTCRRKAYYQYELGIERMDDEEREALVFGSIWHEGLRAWFETFLAKDSDNGDGDNQQAGNGLVRNNAASQTDPLWF